MDVVDEGISERGVFPQLDPDAVWTVSKRAAAILAGAEVDIPIAVGRDASSNDLDAAIRLTRP